MRWRTQRPCSPVRVALPFNDRFTGTAPHDSITSRSHLTSGAIFMPDDAKAAYPMSKEQRR
jgi:hypothetical protein